MSNYNIQLYEETVIDHAINQDGDQMLRPYGQLLESLSPLRREGQKRFLEILQALNIPKKTIDVILMAPNLYASDQQWLEWLWKISHEPFDVPIHAFLAFSGSVVKGQTFNDVVIDWTSVRGQEELVHKAVRVIYPKPKIADWLPKLLLFFFRLISVPGSLVIILFNQICGKYYVPECIKWTVIGVINVILGWKLLEITMIQMKIGLEAGLEMHLFFNFGLIAVAGVFGICSFYYQMNQIQKHNNEKWVEGKSTSVKRHFASNRTVAVLFDKLFGVSLPMYTSQWVYALIYPLIAMIPAALSAVIKELVVYLNSSKSEQKQDMFTGLGAFMTWMGLFGGNLVTFLSIVQVVGSFVLFQDPALERLTKLNK